MFCRSQSSSLPRSKTSSGAVVAVRSRRSTPGRRPLSSHSWSSWAGGDTDLLQVVGGKGRGQGEFMNPQGIGVTYKGDILVTDSNNQCVQVLNLMLEKKT